MKQAARGVSVLLDIKCLLNVSPYILVAVFLSQLRCCLRQIKQFNIMLMVISFVTVLVIILIFFIFCFRWVEYTHISNITDGASCSKSQIPYTRWDSRKYPGPLYSQWIMESHILEPYIQTMYYWHFSIICFSYVARNKKL